MKYKSAKFSTGDVLVLGTMLIIAMLWMFKVMMSSMSIPQELAPQAPLAQECVQEIAATVKYRQLEPMSFGCTMNGLQSFGSVTKEMLKSLAFLFVVFAVLKPVIMWTANMGNQEEQKRKIAFRSCFYIVVGSILPVL